MKPNNYVSVLLFFISVTALFCIFYPGAMSHDSVQQLEQARNELYDNWHPPIMSVLWHFLIKVSDGPGPMLFIHMLMLSVSCMNFYIWGVRNNLRFSFLYLLIPFFPWVLNFEFVIWKDVGFAYSWLLAISFSLVFWNKKNLLKYFFILIPLLYGFMVRHNSYTAGFIVLLFIASNIRINFSAKMICVIFLINVTLFMALPKITDSIFDAKEMNPLSLVMVDDLIGIQLQGSDVIGNLFSHEEFSDLIKCPRVKNSPVTFAICPSINERYHFIQHNQYSELKTTWISALINHPVEYLIYRARAFQYLLRSFTNDSIYYADFDILNKPYDFASTLVNKTFLQSALIYYVSFVNHSAEFLFKPIFWCLSLIGCNIFLYSSKNSSKFKLYLIPLAGIFYILGYFFTTPEADLRYTYFSSLCGTLSLIMVANYSTIKKLNNNL